jgi:hypothetical protein
MSACSLACLLLAVCTCAQLHGADWPEYMGLHGNLASVIPGQTSSSDPATYRLLWTSEERGMGRGKMVRGKDDYSKLVGPGGDARPLQGGLCSPILAGGLVFLHYFRPMPGPMATSILAGEEIDASRLREDEPHLRILAMPPPAAPSGDRSAASRG